MRPKHYPYSGKIKTSTIEVAKVWENTYLDFIAENQKQQEKSGQELDKSTQRLCQLENNLVGKYLEISGEIAGRIEQENEKDLLVRRAIVTKRNIYRGNKLIDNIVNDIGLCEQAVYVDKKVLDNYWFKVVDLPTIPETINSVDSTNLIRKWLNM
ncbi:hypothetical protein [Streptococcus anginosus]|jgi:hypothetical protein|uniref:hypothetical protein n=1 Tax=Streptococcus anginosus TaxID=1328 RepID=UPI001CD4CCF5|nr:hypothetical protein [Streptococcus anginosus]MCW0964430.1 hypothetical protein [Streptococcus anginosus]MCW0979013.1 hypothetical protein [Streptococcus anginosus]MDB8649085.1 hypothetical protein [Streptococcus anginosus]MED5834367.1 hypothetical protein [Streptococcus anginosus]MED5836320.1 hypothetical protein [Streptococcus anginosus]